MSPLSQDGSRTTRAGILNWGIYSGSKNKEAAWDVLKFFVGHEGQKIVAKYNMGAAGRAGRRGQPDDHRQQVPESVKNFVDSVPFIEIQDSFSLCEDEVTTC